MSIPYGTNYTDHNGEPLGQRRVVLTPASAFRIRPVRWGWEQRMPIGEITLIPGREGVGKSLLLAWMAAQLTRGTLPGTFEGEPRPVFYAASEDSWEYTVAARLRAAGADMHLVYKIDVEDDLVKSRLNLPKDCHQVAEAALDLGAAALMLDPIVSLVDERISPNQSFELRRALEPLRMAAEVAGIMVPALVHFNKSDGNDVLSMIPGARAWAEVARAALALARDSEEGYCVASQVKNNLGKLDLPHMTYEIRSVFVETDFGPSDVGQLVWTGECDTGAAELLERRKNGGGAGRPVSDSTNELVEFIEAQGRPMSLQEIYDKFPAVKQATLRQKLKRAAERGELTNPITGHYGPAWGDTE